MTQQPRETDIRKLPAMILAAIRNGSYHVGAAESLEAIRAMTRIVGRADAAGHDVMPIMVDYAAYVDNAMPRMVDWTESMEDVHELVWPFIASAYSRRSTFWVDAGRPKGVAELTEAFRAWIAEREAEQTCTPSQADADIRAEMERVKTLLPRIGLSYGYIGNIWHGPFRDDRSFMVFTQVMPSDGRSGPFSYGSHASADLPKLRTMVLARLEGWARDLDARLNSGTAHLRSTRHITAPEGRLAA